MIYYDARPACTCGRFVARENIYERDYRDPDAYYGVSTETHYYCSRCGMVKGEPRYVQIKRVDTTTEGLGLL